VLRFFRLPKKGSLSLLNPKKRIQAIPARLPFQKTRNTIAPGKEKTIDKRNPTRGRRNHRTHEKTIGALEKDQSRRELRQKKKDSMVLASTAHHPLPGCGNRAVERQNPLEDKIQGSQKIGRYGSSS
jgi:hypothetical protein